MPARAASGRSSCPVQLILRNSIILESEDGASANLNWAGGGGAPGRRGARRDGGVARGGLRGGGWDGRLRKPSFEGAWGRKAHFTAATGGPVPLAKAL